MRVWFFCVTLLLIIILVWHMKVPIALTLEIFGDEKAPNEDCFRMFNPVSHDEVEEVISKWSAIFFSLLVNLPIALSAVPSNIAGISWDFTESDLILQDSRLWKEFDSLTYRKEEPKKFGRVWQGMDTMSEGLTTLDVQASLQFYLLLCVLLVLMAWLRCGRYYKRLLAYIRSGSTLRTWLSDRRRTCGMNCGQSTADVRGVLSDALMTKTMWPWRCSTWGYWTGWQCTTKGLYPRSWAFLTLTADCDRWQEGWRQSSRHCCGLILAREGKQELGLVSFLSWHVNWVLIFHNEEAHD